MTDTHQTATNALVRSVDLYVWQDPKLPRFGHFDLTTRWRGRSLRAWREAKRLTGVSITVVSSSSLLLCWGASEARSHKGANMTPPSSPNLRPKMFESVGIGFVDLGPYELVRSVEALRVTGGYVVRVTEHTRMIERRQPGVTSGQMLLPTHMSFFLPVDSIDAVRDALFSVDEKGPGTKAAT